MVVFSGFAGHHVAGRYNYIRTLSRSKVNKLFILDDYGYESVGSYYLGDKCKIYDSHAIENLISKIISKCNAKETIFCGSSKGGSAALIYGSIMGVNHIIAGSPQYRIADYLNQNDYHKSIMNAIKRNDGNDEEWLNNCVNSNINKGNIDSKITLIYSSKEKSYTTDMKYLIQDCQSRFRNVELYDELYKEHSEIGKYFSNLLPKLI